MCRLRLLFCVGLMSAGCSGEYILTAGDHVAPTGGPVLAVIRLQRSELYKLAMPVKNAPVQFRVEGAPERVAYTDDLGYAGARLAAPGKAGKYRMSIKHQDSDGDVLSAEATVYAWDAAGPVVAVDFDCLPAVGGQDAKAARSALAGINRRASILYLTSRPVAEHKLVHSQIASAGYPDGPVLLWQRQLWHIRQGGGNMLPEVVVRDRLVSQLAELRKAFPNLKKGVCSTRLAAKAFAEAGLACVIVGPAEVDPGGVVYRKSWEKLVAEGI